jgi:hypothetical protein
MRPGSVAHISSDAAEVQVDGYDIDQIEYHLSPIKKAGLIDIDGVGPMMGSVFVVLHGPGMTSLIQSAV